MTDQATGKHEFRCEWFGWNRAVIGSIIIREHDLTDAIRKAASILQRGQFGSADAHGFFVKVKR